MDNIVEDEARSSNETSSTSTFSVGVGDASTTAEEDDSPKLQNRTLQNRQQGESSDDAEDAQTADGEGDDGNNDADADDEEATDKSGSHEMKLEEFQRNFELLEAAVTDTYVDKTRIDMYLTWLPWVDSGRAGKGHARLLYDEVIPRTIRSILGRRYEPSRAGMVNLFMQTLARRLVDRSRMVSASDIPNFVAEALVQVTNPYAQFYLMHGHEDLIADTVQQNSKLSSASTTPGALGLRSLAPAEVDALKVGDTVHLADDLVSGIIIEQSPTETEVQVRTENGATKWVPKESNFFNAERYSEADDVLAKKDTKEDDDLRLKEEPPRFRVELEPGCLCDARKDGVWYQACVVHANAEDQVQVHYLGFPPVVDLKCPISSPDLAPLNTMSRGRRGLGFVNPELIDQEELEACIAVTEFANPPAKSSEKAFKYVRSRPSYPASSFFIANAEVLLENGLMNIIWNCLETNLKISYMCLYQLTPFFTEPFVASMLPSLPNRTVECVQNLSPEQVRNLSKATVARVVGGTYRLARRSNSRSNALQMAEYLRLEFARKRIESETIVQRVNGLASLNELIDESMAHRKAPFGIEFRGSSLEDGYYCQARVLLNIQPASLAKWCFEKKFLQSIFTGPNVHCELIKRSTRLITFLCEASMFSPNEFNIVWQATKSDDSEISSSSLAVLGTTCYAFPHDEVQTLFKSKLAELDLAKSSCLALLKELLWQRGAPEMARAACDLLWKEVMEKNSEEACLALETGLRAEHRSSAFDAQEAEFRKEIILQFVTEDSLRTSNSLRVLRALVESFPISLDGEESMQQQQVGIESAPDSAMFKVTTRHEIIEWICEDLHLKNLLFSTITGGSEGATTIITTTIDENDTQIRLDFLWFILTNSKLSELDLGTIDVLWNKIPMGSKARDVFFTWLQKACRASTLAADENKREVTITESTLVAVYSKFQTFPEFQSIAAFRVFQAFFVGVNLSKQKLFMNELNTNDGVRVCDENLYGEDTLWEAALESDSCNQVAEAAAGLITLLHQRLATSIADRLWRIREKAVEKCRLRIKRAIEEESFVVLSRCCRLLRHILRDSDADFGKELRADFENEELWEAIRPLGSLGAFPQEVSVTVQNTIKGSPHYNSRYPLIVKAIDPVGKLRGLIARQCELDDPMEVRLFVGGVELLPKHDARTLVSCMPNGPHVLACKRMTGGGGGDKSAMVSTSFSQILPSLMKNGDPNWLGSCSDLLLVALDKCSSSVKKNEQNNAIAAAAWAKEAWELIEALPVSKQLMRTSVDSIGGDFDHDEQEIAPEPQSSSNSSPSRIVDMLLPTESPFRVIYQLRVLEDTLSQLPTQDALCSFVRSRNLFVRLQSLLFALAESRTDFSDSILQWNAYACGLCTSILKDLLTAAAAATSISTTPTSAIPLPVNNKAVGGALPNLLQWPPVTLSLNANTGDMVVSSLHARQMQSVLITHLIPFFLKMSLQCQSSSSESGNSEDFITSIIRSDLNNTTAQDDLFIGTKRKAGPWSSSTPTTPINNSSGLTNKITSLIDIDFQLTTCFQLWAMVVKVDPENHLALDANNQNNEATEEGAAVRDRLKWFISNCDSNVVKGLMLLLDTVHTYRKIFLQFCIAALPTRNVHLLRLTQHLMMDLAQANTLDANEVLATLVDRLRSLPCIEGHPFVKGEPYSDKVDVETVGLLHLIKYIVPFTSQFSLSSFDSVADCVMKLDDCKCERSASRSVAYEAILSYCETFPNEADGQVAKRLRTLVDAANDESATALSHWNCDPCSDIRSPLGLSGLINLGCTCYINALVQQLWNIPRIRMGFRALKFLHPPSSAVAAVGATTTTVSGGKRNSNLSPAEASAARKKEEHLQLLLLLQSCMTHLSHSSRRACTLESFVRSFKDENGLPTNVLEQQDAEDFFEKTCDRLDDSMASQGNDRLFLSTFGVKIATELICLDDPSQGRREKDGTSEWALKLHLVPGGGTLQQSLDKFFSGEYLTDFRWVEKGPICRTLQKTFISSLSDTLSIHIKRFHMNWETMLTEKLNDRLEFPQELDMFPYTKEGMEYAERQSSSANAAIDDSDKYTVAGRTKDYYCYRLVGVLVHSGANLNAGHYYSHILSRFPGPTFGRWYTFNDTNVNLFNVNDLKDSTFGGTVKQTVVLQDTKTFQEIETVITHSAYMLFYERERPLGADFNNSVGGETSAALGDTVADPQVVRENRDHLLGCRVFDPALLNFLLARSTESKKSVTLIAADSKDKSPGFTNKKKRLLAPPTSAPVDEDLVKRGTVDESVSLPPPPPRTESAELLTVILTRFLVGEAVAARSASSGTIYPLLSEKLRKYLGASEVNANAFLESNLCLSDLQNLLIESHDLRTRISFSSLVATACAAADEEIARKFLASTLLNPKLVDLALTNPDNPYWYCLRLVLEQRDDLALSAFDVGLSPHVFNAILHHESPSHDFEKASSGGAYLPYRKRPISVPPPPPPPPPSSSTSSSQHVIRHGWDHAVAALAACATAALDAKRHLNPQKKMDEASMLCLESALVWIAAVGAVSQTETIEKVFNVLSRILVNQMESDSNLAVKIAKYASTSSLDSIGRYYDLISHLGVEYPQIPVVFFLGGQDEATVGFLRRVVSNRSSLFAFSCVALFVERLDDFPQMKAPVVLEQWVENVDSFLKEDALTSALEPREINRALAVMEVLAQFYDSSLSDDLVGMNPRMPGGNAPGRPASGLDCDTASTASPPANGWNSDADDNDDDDDMLYDAPGDNYPREDRD